MLDISANLPNDGQPQDLRHSDLTESPSPTPSPNGIPAGFVRDWPDVPTGTWRWTDRRHWSAPHPAGNDRVWVAVVAFGRIVGSVFLVKGLDRGRAYAGLVAEAARIANIELAEPPDDVIAVDYGDGEPCVVFRDDEWDDYESTTCATTTTLRWRPWMNDAPSSLAELHADAAAIYTLQPTTADAEMDYSNGTHLVVASAATPTRWTLIRRDDRLATQASEFDPEVDPLQHRWFEIASGDQTGWHEDRYRYNDEPPYALGDLVRGRTVYTFETFQATNVRVK